VLLIQQNPGSSCPGIAVVASLAYSRSKNGVASLAYSRSKNGVASLAYVPGVHRLGVART
jgi:hypothetical protein